MMAATSRRPDAVGAHMHRHLGAVAAGDTAFIVSEYLVPK
jgi:hypothetical protein